MGKRRILIVEDEPQLIVLLEKHLTRLGFEVDAHSTAGSALRALQDPAQAYDLAVSDMGLPDMPGEDLLREIFALQPNLPVLICSGSEFFISNIPEPARHRVAFLQKPFLPRELVKKIEEMLPR